MCCYSLAQPVSATVLCNNKFDLFATAADPNALGTAKAQSVLGNNGVSLQKVQFSVELLLATTAYKVFVNGVDLGSFTTDETGSAEAVLSNKNGVLPAPFLDVCVISLIEIKTADGMVVLTSASAGGS